jgi:nucleotide-binding universal stress UspA family protein
VPPRRWLTGRWGSDPETVSAVHRRAGAALKRLAETLDPSRQIELSTGLVSGAASVEIGRAARQFGADLLVIGARGEHEVRRGKSALGGTALKLLSRTAVPMVLVRVPAAEAPRSVLAAVDLSPVSNIILTWASTLVAADGRIDVLHAFEAPFAARLNAYGIARESIELYADEEQSQRERELNTMIAAAGATVAVQGTVERGDPIDRLFERIHQLEPNLIVLGKHTKRPDRRSSDRAGSVSRHMAFFAPANVLIVPPPAASGSDEIDHVALRRARHSTR